MTTTSANETAQETASTAADQGKHVADVAREEAQTVAGEAARQARNLVDESMTQVSAQLGDQSREQRDRLVGTLQTFSDDLEKMTAANERPGLATDIVREVAHRARSLGSALDGREPQDLVDDVRRFARRRPGTFLMGALAAGLVVGRLARGAKQGASEGSSAGGTTTPPAPSPDPATHDVVGDGYGQPTIEPQAHTAPGTESGPGTQPAGYDQHGTGQGGLQ